VVCRTATNQAADLEHARRLTGDRQNVRSGAPWAALLADHRRAHIGGSVGLA